MTLPDSAEVLGGRYDHVKGGKKEETVNYKLDTHLSWTQWTLKPLKRAKLLMTKKVDGLNLVPYLWERKDLFHIRINFIKRAWGLLFLAKKL